MSKQKQESPKSLESTRVLRRKALRPFWMEAALIVLGFALTSSAVFSQSFRMAGADAQRPTQDASVSSVVFVPAAASKGADKQVTPARGCCYVADDCWEFVTGWCDVDGYYYEIWRWTCGANGADEQATRARGCCYVADDCWEFVTGWCDVDGYYYEIWRWACGAVEVQISYPAHRTSDSRKLSTH
jgi:hypothetical protein